MKILKKILYGILILFVLLSGFILICAVKPELSEQIADTLGIGGENQLYYATASRLNSIQETDNTNDLALIDDSQMLDVSTADVVEEDTTPQYEAPSSGVVWADERDDDDTQDIDPSLFGLTVPSAVAGKNGYEPVTADNSEIDDEEAANLLNEISTGETGDSLTFDSRFYPYYYMLDAKGQHLYRQIYANANALNDRFAPVESVSVSELKKAFEAVYNDHPELFWVDTAYSCKYKSNGQCAEIDLQFNYTADNLASEKTTFNAKSSEIVSEAAKLETNYEKEKYVHDALIKNAEYVSYADINQSAYSALVNGSTVCAGYARAFQYMMQQLRIPCYYCTGYAGESHAWDIVALDDGYYNVDATWDDTGSGTYDYFNKSDADFSWNHVRQNLSVYLPPCNGIAYRNLEGDDQDESEDNEEGEEEEYDSRRSIDELGLSKENSVTTLSDYYSSCARSVLSHGKGSYTFTSLLSGRTLFNDVYSAYHNNGYRQGYMDSAISQLGASVYRINWKIEALQDDYYLVTHEVAIQ